MSQEPTVQGWDNDAQLLVVSEQKLDDVLALAEVVADALVTTEPCPPADEPCVRERATHWSRRAWGRAADEEELTRLEAVARSSTSAGLRQVARAIVLSPSFLYRTELGSAHDPTTLSGPELASLLSFFLVGERPDDALLEDAATGALLDPAVRVAHAQRLLGTRAGRLRVRSIFKSWLGVHHLVDVAKDPVRYHLFTHEMRVSLETELDTAIDDALFGTPTTVQGLLTRETAWPDALVAGFYADALRSPAGNFTPVATVGTLRRGILTMPGFLARHSAVGSSAPIERGLFIRNRLLCQEIGAPPPDVVTMLVNDPAAKTTRQKYAAHSQDARCRGCHVQIDPLGFAFEHYDEFGRYRTTEANEPIDASGQLVASDVNGEFSDATELVARLGESEWVRRCVAQQLWRAAMGRAVTLPFEAVPPPDTTLTALLIEVVRSDAFTRRVEEAP
jgi:hypothetical protein